MRKLPVSEIRQAAALYRAGESYAKIADRLKKNVSTIKRWSKTSVWQAETDQLEQIEREAAATMALKYKQEYVAQLLRSRDLIRQIADQQVQVAGQLSIAANKAIRAIAQNSDPIAAVEAIAKSGTCHVTISSAQVAKAAKDLLNEVYAINRVLEFLESQVRKNEG